MSADLLQQAIDGLGTSQRASMNLDLARIQNIDNVHHDVPTLWPGFDLCYALRRYAKSEWEIAKHDWDYGYGVKGLS